MTTQRKKTKTRTVTSPKAKRSIRAARRAPAAPAPQATVSLAALPVASVPPRGREFLDSNVPGLGHDATNAFERHVALDHVVTNVWATEDITMIRRVESAGAFKWVMWRRSDIPPA